MAEESLKCEVIDGSREGVMENSDSTSERWTSLDAGLMAADIQADQPGQISSV